MIKEETILGQEMTIMSLLLYLVLELQEWKWLSQIDSEENDRVLVPTNGKFGERVAEMCDRYCNLKHMRYEWGRAFDLYEMEMELEKEFTRQQLLAGITQDAEAIAEMCQRHDVAFILDGITSIGGMPVHPEKWNAEALVVGAQKCTAVLIRNCGNCD